MSVSSIRDHMASSAAVKAAVAEECSDAAAAVAAAIASSLQQGGKLMLCGNGGSAGDAQHIAAEFVATLDHRRPRKGLRALALTTDSSFITAYSNDFGFSGIFTRQVETFGDTGDVLIGISTSGNSENVLEALEMARNMGMVTVAMTGKGGGKLAAIADHLIAVPATETPFIQESHIALGHAITSAVETQLGY